MLAVVPRDTRDDRLVDIPRGQPFALQDALRTVGLTLERRRVARAVVRVDAVGITIEAGKRYGYRVYAWRDLDHLSQAQRHYGRRRPLGTDPWAITRWSVFLRAVGRLLDQAEVRVCRLYVMLGRRPPDCVLQVTAVGRFGLRADDVRLDLLRQRAECGAPPPRRSLLHWLERWRVRGNGSVPASEVRPPAPHALVPLER